MNSSPKEYIGVDYGSARVGLARGSDAARLAQPLKTILSKDAVAELAGLADTGRANGIVVGLPRNLAGEDTAQTKTVRDWVQTAKSRIHLPFYWQDEALTSRQATKVQSSKFKNQSADEHAEAAAIILQDFLQSSENDRVAA